ncbi:restriction endonuclease [Halorubrum terrestre]|uniref:Restriction endonuclease n=1 Tax=Halorubrum distributum TaxID=29283 RepID=A0A6B1INS0_9EURY|nr:restriction endonuclease [Halorubrum terrestre]MYL16745.1 restriction endonuclease [Halorubrum terrestre]
MSDTQWTNKFDPYDFEEFVAGLWEANGYTTHVRKGSGDRGIDIEATRGDNKELIQVKLYSPGNKIGSSDVREYATLYQQVPEADDVIIVTSSSFTSEAQRLADDLGVLLVDGQMLGSMFSQSDLDSYDVSVKRRSTVDSGTEIGPVGSKILGAILSIIVIGGLLLIAAFLVGFLLAVF